MRWLGSETRGGAMLRAATALVAVWAMLFFWGKLMVRFLLSDTSTRYLTYLKAQTGGEGWYYAAAEVPTYAAGLLIGLVTGLALALAFRQQPLRVARATALILMALLVFSFFTGGVEQMGTQLRFGALGLFMAAGLFVAPWLLQRRRQRFAA